MIRFFVLTSILGLLCHPVFARETGPIDCVEPDPSFDEQFETVAEIADFEDGLEGWRAVRGGQAASATLRTGNEAARGAKSLRVDYAFSGRESLEYVDIATSIPIEKPNEWIGFAFRRDDCPLKMRIRVVDPSGETHQITPRIERCGEWEIAVADPSQSHDSHWGGDGNGRLEYPCRLVSIVADRPETGYRGEGTLLLDRVRLLRKRSRVESDRPRVTVTPVRFGCVYEPGEDLELAVSGQGDEIAWELHDFFGRMLKQGKGSAEKTSVTLPCAHQGYFACTLSLLRDGKAVGKSEFRYAVLPKPGAARNPFVGFCCHFRWGAYPMECMDLLSRYGFSEFRDEISWQNVEPEVGRYVIPEYGERFTARAKELGLNPLLIFDYGNSHYNGGGFPNDAATIDAYAKYCAELTRMLGDRVHDFEIWNEWSVACGMRGKPGSNKPEYYGKMLVAAHEAIKAVNPAATVVGIGGEHDLHHYDNIRVMFETAGGKPMDAFSVHSYRYPRSPEQSDLFEGITRVGKLAREFDAPERIWVTEIGWPTHVTDRGVDERTQAIYLVRTLALLQATRLVEKVHWYDFKDDGVNREYNENNFGVVRHQRFHCAPKPAVVAASVFARMTAGAKVVSFERNGVYRVNYRTPDGNRLAVIWAPEGEKPVELDLRRTETCYDVMGERLPEEEAVEIGTAPVYVVGGDEDRRGTAKRHE